MRWGTVWVQVPLLVVLSPAEVAVVELSGLEAVWIAIAFRLGTIALREPPETVKLENYEHISLIQ